MREGLEDLPKPMAMVGDRPLIWHVMRYYAHFGHTEFILCMGYGARHITRYLLDYEETRSTTS
jgi:glucose-1-phosphate cytidylyltransferase